jgi:hypothetical protein
MDPPVLRVPRALADRARLGVPPLLQLLQLLPVPGVLPVPPVRPVPLAREGLVVLQLLSPPGVPVVQS